MKILITIAVIATLSVSTVYALSTYDVKELAQTYLLKNELFTQENIRVVQFTDTAKLNGKDIQVACYITKAGNTASISCVRQ